MPEIGQTVSHYRIIEKLGQGGMGEVFLAQDTSLDRKVALKFLPDIFSGDPERLARFEREAKLLASLNHPNIAAIFGFEQAEGRRFLVMELVEGETLAGRIAKGPLPVDEALEVCRQIADGVEAAHEKGVIHRDLKPANVKITPEGKVKVLDFGLAKAFQDEMPAADASHSPTLTDQMTRPGVILGTAAYMAPEQAKGKAVDKRADVWAFGCVLYECLTGKRAFEGVTVTETLASILKGEPDWQALPNTSPPGVMELLRRCLQKDPKERLRDIGDARIEIADAMKAEAFPPVEKTGLSSRSLVPLVIFLALACLTMGLAITWLLTGRPKQELPLSQLVRFPLPLPPDQNFTRLGFHAIALSPDGSHLAYSANGQIFLRSMDDMESLPVRGTEQALHKQPARNPFFSPDGKQLGFWADGKLWKVPLNGGPASPICECMIPTGVTWEDGDTILFGQEGNGIWRVAAGASKAKQLIEANHDKLEFLHGPQMLPGGEWLLFTSAAAGIWDRAEIVIKSLKTKERKILMPGRDARYISTGHLVWVSEQTLWAAPMDLKELRLTGEPARIVDGILASSNSITGAAQYSVSTNGMLAYVPGGAGSRNQMLVWVDRQGKESPATPVQLPYRELRLSPDDKSLAVIIQNEKGDRELWVYDLHGNNAPIPLMRGGACNSPVWEPGGNWIVFGFAKDSGSPSDLYRISADGGGKPELLWASEGSKFPWSLTPDGGQLLFMEVRKKSANISVLQMQAGRQARLLLESKFGEQEPAVNPGGRWIAYVSYRSGNGEIWIASYPDLHGMKRVTTNGARQPLWSRDGKKLYYATLANKKLMEAVFDPVRGEVVGQPKQIFERQANLPGLGSYEYDVTKDGQILTIVGVNPASDATAPRPSQINIVLNWLEELKRLVPVK